MSDYTSNFCFNLTVFLTYKICAHEFISGKWYYFIVVSVMVLNCKNMRVMDWKMKGDARW